MGERSGRKSQSQSRTLENIGVYLVCFAVMAGWVFGMERHAPVPRLQERNGDQPLSLKLTIPKELNCQRSVLPLKAELTNQSSKDIAIDTKGLRYRISFQRFRTRANGASNRSMSIQGDFGPDPYDESGYLILKPGASYKDTIDFRLLGKFFTARGEYKVSSTYGQFRQYLYKGVPLFVGTTKSKDVPFNLVRCKAG